MAEHLKPRAHEEGASHRRERRYDRAAAAITIGSNQRKQYRTGQRSRFGGGAHCQSKKDFRDVWFLESFNERRIKQAKQGDGADELCQ